MLPFIIGQEALEQERQSGTWISKEIAEMINGVFWEYMEKGQKGKKIRE